MSESPGIAIRAATSLGDPDMCTFSVDRPLLPGRSRFFGDIGQAVGSPLASRLFALPGVASVLLADNLATIGRAQDRPWPELKVAIGSAIRAHLHSGLAALGGTAESPEILPARGADICMAAQTLLDAEMNPSVAAHGGKISVTGFDEGKLFVTMSGGCQGCASSRSTLRNGVESLILRAIPGIAEIVDTTDHMAGQKPYYPRR